LLAKYFHSLTKLNIVPQKTFHITHYFIRPYLSYSSTIKTSKRKFISLIRDPRDVLCSLINWLEKGRNSANSPVRFTKNWFQLTKSEKLHILIDTSISREKLLKYLRFKREEKTLPQMIQAINLRAVSFNKFPEVMTIRFEDIIGDQGSGNSSKQRETFSSINHFLNIQIEENLFSDILESLWGNKLAFGIKMNSTFDKGYIGRWREEFDEKAVYLMKKYHNDILIELGYETDENWTTST